MQVWRKENVYYRVWVRVRVHGIRYLVSLSYYKGNAITFSLIPFLEFIYFPCANQRPPIPVVVENELTISRENLPVSFSVYVKTSSENADNTSPRSEDADLNTEREEKNELPPLCEYVSYLVHLAVFGILGVFTRYLLQNLFGPGVTSDNSILYLDLPSNMVGCCLMGWLGVAFQSHISRFSDQLATGLSTGYLGSLTTFSGWNQKMLELSITRHWGLAMLGYIIGLILAAGSITFGIETASGFKSLLRQIRKDPSIKRQNPNRSKYYLIIPLLVLIFMWTGLWDNKWDFVEERIQRQWK